MVTPAADDFPGARHPVDGSADTAVPRWTPMQDSDTQSLIAVDADDRRTGVVEKMAAHGYGPVDRGLRGVDPWAATLPAGSHQG